jgi:polysaccharide export outer membrane protein
MNGDISGIRGATKGRLVGVAFAVGVYGFCLLGCEGSLDGQMAGQGTTAAIAAPEASKQGKQAAKELSRTLDKYSSATTPGSSAYKVGPLDVLEVTVFQVQDLTRSIQVGESGTINLPLAGEIRAAGRTAQEIEKEIASRLAARYLRNPQVTVYVREYNSQRATIEGSIKKPGVYPIRGKTTLMQFVAMAQGMDRETASNDVAVFRTVDGKRSVARFNVSDIRSGISDDPVILQGDVIIVESSTSKTIVSGILRVLPVTTTFTALLL